MKKNTSKNPNSIVKQVDYKILDQKMKEIDWSNLLESSDPIQATNNLHTNLNKAVLESTLVKKSIKRI